MVIQRLEERAKLPVRYIFGKEVIPSRIFKEVFDKDGKYKIELSEITCEYMLSQPTEIFNLSLHKMKLFQNDNLKTYSLPEYVRVHQQEHPEIKLDQRTKDYTDYRLPYQSSQPMLVQIKVYNLIGSTLKLRLGFTQQEI